MLGASRCTGAAHAASAQGRVRHAGAAAPSRSRSRARSSWRLPDAGDRIYAKSVPGAQLNWTCAQGGLTVANQIPRKRRPARLTCACSTRRPSASCADSADGEGGCGERYVFGLR